MSDLYILFICIAVPQLFLLKLLAWRPRFIVFYEVLGFCMCLLAANINGLIAQRSPYSALIVTITFTPIVEEILKAIPVILFALFVTDETQLLTSVGMSLGAGFAILENAYILLRSSNVDLVWALFRGAGSGLMHGLSTAVVAFGISKMDRDRRLFAVGVYALVAAVSIFHGTYNVLVQSPYKYAGILLPVLCYLPFMSYTVRTIRKQRAARAQKTGA